jgi:transcriptional regulator with XRE-family HTH domain
VRVNQWLYDRCQKSGLSRADLAATSGVSVRTLARIEAGAAGRDPSHAPSAATIRLLAATLQYGPAAVNYLIAHAGRDFDPAERLDVLVNPIERKDR